MRTPEAGAPAEARDRGGRLRLPSHHGSQRALPPGEDLPGEYLYALLEFRYALGQASKGPLGELKHTAVASPPMRSLFVRVPPPEGELNKIRVQPRSAKMSPVESQVIWLLRVLWEDDCELFLARLPAFVDELERLTQAEREVRQLLSPRIASTTCAAC